MRSMLPLLFLALPLVAEDVTPPKPPAPPTPEQRKEMQETRQQLMALREKAMQDPEVVKLKQAADEANKALRAKLDEVLAREPGYAALRAKIEAGFGMRSEGRPPKHDRNGGEGAPPAPAPAPAPAP